MAASLSSIAYQTRSRLGKTVNLVPKKTDDVRTQEILRRVDLNKNVLETGTNTFSRAKKKAASKVDTGNSMGLTPMQDEQYKKRKAAELYVSQEVTHSDEPAVKRAKRSQVVQKVALVALPAPKPVKKKESRYFSFSTQDVFLSWHKMNPNMMGKVERLFNQTWYDSGKIYIKMLSQLNAVQEVLQGAPSEKQQNLKRDILNLYSLADNIQKKLATAFPETRQMRANKGMNYFPIQNDENRELMAYVQLIFLSDELGINLALMQLQIKSLFAKPVVEWDLFDGEVVTKWAELTPLIDSFEKAIQEFQQKLEVHFPSRN